jgi:ribosomal protein L10
MRTTLACLLVLGLVSQCGAEEKLFSGPQVGEGLPGFTVKGVFEPDAGKDLDFVAAAKTKPIVLVFVHDVNRQSISMVRTLTGYTKSRVKDGLTTGVVWLADDATEGENALKRNKHALTEGTPTGISPDGREGPGKYGLNRKVTLTILVGNKDKVTANFALVQPSVQADLPKILDAIVKEVGGTAPKVEDLLAGPKREPDKRPAPDENLRGLLRPLIQKDATPEDVDKAAKAIEEYVAKNEAARKEVGRIANTIIDAGKLTDYGTPKAQEYLKKWAKDFGKPK